MVDDAACNREQAHDDRMQVSAVTVTLAAGAQTGVRMMAAFRRAVAGFRRGGDDD